MATLSKAFKQNQVLKASELNEIVSFVNGISSISQEDLDSAIAKYQSNLKDLEEQLSNAEDEVNALAKLFSDAAIDKLNSTMSSAKAKYDAAVAEIADAKDQIAKANEILSDLTESEGDSDIITSIGKIEELTSWYDTNKETITNIDSILDSVNGIKEDLASQIDTINGTVTTIKSEWDTKNASITETINTVSTFDGRVTKVESALDAQDESITNIVTRVDTVSGRVTTAESNISGLMGYILLKASVTDLDNLKTEIGTIKTNSDSITARVASLEADYDSQSSTIELLNNKISEVVTSTDAGGNVINSAAIIAAINNDDSGNSISKITLSADQINLIGDTVAENINTIDLTVGGGSSQFNADGSGHVANGAISWDARGNSTGITLNDSLYIPKLGLTKQTVLSNSSEKAYDEIVGSASGLLYNFVYANSSMSVYFCIDTSSADSSTYGIAFRTMNSNKVFTTHSLLTFSLSKTSSEIGKYDILDLGDTIYIIIPYYYNTSSTSDPYGTCIDIFKITVNSSSRICSLTYESSTTPSDIKSCIFKLDKIYYVSLYAASKIKVLYSTTESPTNWESTTFNKLDYKAISDFPEIGNAVTTTINEVEYAIINGSSSSSQHIYYFYHESDTLKFKSLDLDSSLTALDGDIIAIPSKNKVLVMNNGLGQGTTHIHTIVANGDYSLKLSSDYKTHDLSSYIQSNTESAKIYILSGDYTYIPCYIDDTSHSFVLLYTNGGSNLRYAKLSDKNNYKYLNTFITTINDSVKVISLVNYPSGIKLYTEKYPTTSGTYYYAINTTDFNFDNIDLVEYILNEIG